MNILQYIVQISDPGFTKRAAAAVESGYFLSGAVLAVIDNAGWLKHCTYYKIDGRKPRPFVSLDDFIPCTQGWKSLLHLSNQMDMDESYHAEIYASFHPRWNALDFFIVFSPAFVDAGPDGFWRAVSNLSLICTLNSRRWSARARGECAVRDHRSRSSSAGLAAARERLVCVWQSAGCLLTALLSTAS